MTVYVFLLSTIAIVTGYKNFQELIPNGNNIMHPCDRIQPWSGLGHLKTAGGGERNQFGKDFKAASKTWTKELCLKDSDGDGRTNGQELGDPKCIWTPGDVLESSEELTHPGICEPVGSTQCKEYNKQFGDTLDCTTNIDTTCPAITQPGILKQHLRFPMTSIPGDVTNYNCMLFDMPSGGDFHLVATTPIINNSDIVHHMILFGCDMPEDRDGSSVPQSATQNKKEKPYKCGMNPHRYCQQLIGTWTIGSGGDCVSRKAGFRIGRHGYKTAALQIHWNNPDRLTDQQDNSGMTIYYTDDRRTYDAAIFLVGQEHLVIPPKTSNIAFDATCPSGCTSDMFKETVYISRAVNHMHYLGVSQQMVLYRNGHIIKVLTDDRSYHYDSPKFYHFDPPIEVHPGDEIRTRCEYSSDRSSAVYFGAATQDEMCYGFLTYYPSQNITPTFCASWKSVQRCERYLPKYGGMIGSCKWRQLLNPVDPITQKLYAKFYAVDNCGSFAKYGTCSHNCTKLVRTLSDHPCLKDDIGDFVKFKLSSTGQGQMFVETLKTCAPEINYANVVHSQRNYLVILVCTLFWVLT